MKNRFSFETACATPDPSKPEKKTRAFSKNGPKRSEQKKTRTVFIRSYPRVYVWGGSVREKRTLVFGGYATS